MKRFIAPLIYSLWVAVALGAEPLTVEVSFDRDEYLAGEEVTAKVKITNHTGQTLNLAGTPGWISFTIDCDPKRFISQRDVVPKLDEFQLDSSMKATYRVDLAPLFDLANPGRYHVRATVRLPKMQGAIESRSTAFNVIAGVAIWEQDFGMPRPAGVADGGGGVRKYALILVKQDRHQQIYLRLSDTKLGQVLRVKPLGPWVTLSKPDGQLDQWSNLHLLYQSGAKQFLYTMVNPDGVILARESYLWTETRPRFDQQKNGQIKITGGVRVRTSEDIPPLQARATSALPIDATPRQP